MIHHHRQSANSFNILYGSRYLHRGLHKRISKMTPIPSKTYNSLPGILILELEGSLIFSNITREVFIRRRLDQFMGDPLSAASWGDQSTSNDGLQDLTPIRLVNCEDGLRAFKMISDPSDPSYYDLCCFGPFFRPLYDGDHGTGLVFKTGNTGILVGIINYDPSLNASAYPYRHIKISPYYDYITPIIVR